MKHHPLARPMASLRPLPGTLLLVLVATLLMPAAPAHTDAGAHHVHLHISLGQDSEWAEEIPPGQLHHRMEGTLVVEAHEGETVLRFPLPTEADLQDFVAPGHGNTTRTATAEAEGIQSALLIWEEDAPPAGTEVHDVVLVAVRDVDPETSFTIGWPGLGDLTELDVRVEAPAGHTLSSGRELIRQQHGPEGRHVWSTFDWRTDELQMSLSPPYTGSDPALAAPPHPLGGWAILLGIALVAGGAWFLGKRLETPSE